jgi:hypothetical protein
MRMRVVQHQRELMSWVSRKPFGGAKGIVKEFRWRASEPLLSPLTTKALPRRHVSLLSLM